MDQPPYRQLSLIVLVAAGGMVGTAGRYALAHAITPAGGWPLATLTANLCGAFALGWLLEALARHAVQGPRELRLRLALGTGVLGGFTTFSSLAIEVERLIAQGRLGVAVAYTAVSLVAGVALCLAGVALAARHRSVS